MTPDQRALAKRLVACDQWRWVPGVQAYERGINCRVVGKDVEVWIRKAEWVDPSCTRDNTILMPYCQHLIPDLSDYATAAILLRKAEEQHNGWSMRYRRDYEQWTLTSMKHGSFGPGDLGSVAARALLHLWEWAGKE